MKRKRNKQITLGLKIATHLGAILPLIWLYYQWYHRLLIDENNAITRFTGKGGLIFLFLMLAITPLITLTGWRQIVPLRKWFGLYAFGYICIHLLIFVVPLADIALIIDEVLLKRYALVGFSAWLLMIPLAITSNKWSIKKLKKRWKTLHKLVYVTSVLALIHYFWLVKVGAYREPLIATALMIPLFVLRIPAVRKRVAAWRRKALQKPRI